MTQTLTTERQQFAEQNEMSMEFVNWFFDEKKDGCGNAWFIMAAAMWEGWKGRANREAQPVAIVEPSDYVTAAQLVGEGPARKAVHELYEGALVIGQHLYAAPPAPAVPEEANPDSIEILASARRRDHAVFQWDEDQRNAAADSWNACRAAKLENIDKPAPQLDSVVTRHAEQPVSSGYTLNPPEIPDGWIACSERMPADTQTVLCSNLLTELSGIPFIADYVGAFQLYDGTKYESGFYINRERQTVTHWMPLPAAPDGGNDHDTRR